MYYTCTFPPFYKAIANQGGIETQIFESMNPLIINPLLTTFSFSCNPTSINCECVLYSINCNLACSAVSQRKH